MGSEPFNACWDRLERASTHRGNLTTVWNEYIEEDPYDVTLTHQGDGVHVLEVWEDNPIPPQFALEFGEWLYNARACLDYIIWATAAYVTGQMPPPKEHVLQYPVYDTDNAWTKNLPRLRSLAPRHQERLLQMQPFNARTGSNYLKVLNHLARVDRHRRLTISAAHLAEIQPAISLSMNANPTIQWGQRLVVDGHAEVARIVVSPWDPAIEVSVNPRIGIDPDVAEWPELNFWRKFRFGDRLRMIELFLAAEIATYEFDCTGSSRSSDLLTDQYVAECEERGALDPIIMDAAPEVDWGPITEATPSTQARFQGDDLPTGAASPDSPRRRNPRDQA
mgnify:CR=1 FL=1